MKKIIIGCLFVLIFLNKPYLINASNSASNFSVLIIGNDGGGDRDPNDVRADSLMLAVVNPTTAQIHITSIPRDAYVKMPCKRNPDKINHAYAFGKEECTMKTVSNLLQVPVDYYVTINFDSFIKLFDILGPVSLVASHTFCEQDLNSGEICFKEGKTYEMNGAMALAYARHRKSDSDLNRTKRQQEVIEAALTKLKHPQSVTKISQLFKLYNETVSTDIPYSFAFTLLPMLFKNISLTRSTLQGEDLWDDYYYFILNESFLQKTRSALRALYFTE